MTPCAGGCSMLLSTESGFCAGRGRHWQCGGGCEALQVCHGRHQAASDHGRRRDLRVRQRDQGACGACSTDQAPGQVCTSPGCACCQLSDWARSASEQHLPLPASDLCCERQGCTAAAVHCPVPAHVSNGTALHAHAQRAARQPGKAWAGAPGLSVPAKDIHPKASMRRP